MASKAEIVRLPFTSNMTDLPLQTTLQTPPQSRGCKGDFGIEHVPN